MITNNKDELDNTNKIKHYQRNSVTKPRVTDLYGTTQFQRNNSIAIKQDRAKR